MTEKRFDKNDKIYIGIIAALVIAIGVLTWNVFDQKTFIDSVVLQQGELEAEKDNLTGELQEMLEEYDKLETENEVLSEEMLAQKEEISNLLDQIEKNKNDTRLMYKYKKEVGSLRTIMVGYVVTIDSLNTLNQNLSEENFHIRGELGTVRNSYNTLNSEKSKLEDRISRGATLTAFNIEAGGIRIRTNGRQATTWRSGRTEMVRACFTLDENKVTEPGDKDIYLRVINPDGTVLLEEGGNEENHAFVAEKEKMVFSAMRTINYQNAKTDACVYCEINKDLPAGDYKVELYEAKKLIGVSSFKLR
jgi:FtsZ-binding cell division protein ZapB